MLFALGLARSHMHERVKKQLWSALLRELSNKQRKWKGYSSRPSRGSLFRIKYLIIFSESTFSNNRFERLENCFAFCYEKAFLSFSMIVKSSCMYLTSFLRQWHKEQRENVLKMTTLNEYLIPT